MKPRTRSLIPASIGSNQASPANRSVPFIRVVVLSCSMAWSPPARQRRSWLVEQAGGYAKPNFHHIRDGTCEIVLQPRLIEFASNGVGSSNGLVYFAKTSGWLVRRE